MEKAGADDGPAESFGTKMLYIRSRRRVMSKWLITGKRRRYESILL
jgi:hypothetical protein